MLLVSVNDLNDIKVEPKEVHPMYSPVSYNAGYNQALKDIKEAYNGLTVYNMTTRKECREFISKCHVPTHRKEVDNEDS